MSTILEGKGYYLWKIDRVEGGSPYKIAEEAHRAGLSHVLIKVADGRGDYNVDSDSKRDLVPPLIEALRARGIQPWGWHYIYGKYPQTEAKKAIERINQLDLDGYIVNAEKEFKFTGMDVPARTYMQELRKKITNIPIGLSTYRYPSYHRPFPFETFLDYSDINMPQVYWVQANNPGAQLLKSMREYQNLRVWRTYFPTGAAYGEHGWRATPEQVSAFLKAVRDYNLPGANFWEWYYSKQNDGRLWEPVQNFPWPGSGSSQPDVSLRYVDALNEGDPDKVAALYKQNGVHVTAKRTLQSPTEISNWYSELLTEQLPNARFQITGNSEKDNMRTLTWTAQADTGRVLDGKDSIGVKDEQIAYHYSYFTVQSN